MAAVNGTHSSAQKERKEERQSRLRQFRGLHREWPCLEPSMTRRICDVDQQEQKQHNSEPGKRYARIIPLAVIALHAVQKRQDGKHRPPELPEKKIGSRNVEF